LNFYSTIQSQLQRRWPKPTLPNFGIAVFPSKKAQMYGMEIDLSWANCWLVRFRSAYLCFMSRLRTFGPRL